MRFQDRVVIVTGGSKGIGAGCASVFCEAGALVAILSRGAEAGEALARELTEKGPGKAIYFPCNVSRHEQIQVAIERTVEEFGRLDCLINNAGWHPPATSIEETSVQDLQSLLDLNYIGTFAGSRYAIPHLKKTKGTIVNISSMVGILGQDMAAAYCGSKAAQLGLTRALAKELGPQGIRVNAILPGNIDTPLMHEWAATLDDPELALERVAQLQVFGRMGTAEEMGRIVLFLATDESSFLTGQCIQAEGGASLDY